MMRMIKAMFRRQRMLPDDGVLLRPFPANFDLRCPSRRERIEIEHRTELMDTFEYCDWRPESLEK